MKKGIILAGGHGTRLDPLTRAVSKQLLPVFDKPMIYYPLATLAGAGVLEILIITTERDGPAFQRLLGDGGQFGLSLNYTVQDEPRGIAEALIIAEDFMAGESVWLILGDNLFQGSELTRQLRAGLGDVGCKAFAHQVANAGRYGVIDFDEFGNPLSLVEKPAEPLSNWALTGIYGLDGSAPSRAKRLTPSARGELEIVDLLTSYLNEGDFAVAQLPAETIWLDMGTPEQLLEAANLVQAIQVRQGYQLGDPGQRTHT